MRVLLSILVGCLVGVHSLAPQLGKPPDQVIKLLSIHPIESKAEDVKKLLGDPLEKSPDFYKLDEINLMISYEGGSPCDPDCVKKGQYCGWNVPRDTVITVKVFVKVAFDRKYLKDIGIDLSKYEREETDHVPGTVYYSNEEDGIRIVTNGDQVQNISLFPSKKYLHLMCPQPKPKPVCSDRKFGSSERSQ